MKHIYYKEAMIGDQVYKGDRVSIATKDDGVVITEYVDFVDGRSVETARYYYPLTTMTFEDACRKYVSGGYKEVKEEIKEIKTREEQIAEMAKAMGDFEMEDAAKCDIELSEHLFAKGYRKQSDTVKEFVERVKEIFDKNYLRYDKFDLWSSVVHLAADEYGVEVEE